MSYKLLFLILVPVGLFFVPNVIKIKKIDCSSQFGPCSNVITEGLLKYKEASLRQSKKEITSFLSTQTQVKDFSLRFKLPATLTVAVLDKKGRFALKDKEKGVYLIVGEDGEVLAISQETNLPYVEEKPRATNTGEKVTEKELSALFLQERVSSAYQVRKGELTDEFLLVYLPDGFTALFPLDREPEELMGALGLILSSLKGEVEGSKIEMNPNLKTIDLRFRNPVLR